MRLDDDDLKSLWQQETVTMNHRAECPSSDLLVRAGEGNLNAEERALTISHLSQCADCAEEYRIALSTREWATQAVANHAEAFPARTVTNAPASTSESWWRRLFQMQTPALAIGATLSALLLLAIGWMVWQARKKNDVQPEIAETTPTPAMTVTQDAMPMLLAQLNDGPNLVTLDQQGQLNGIDHLPPAYQQMVRDALTTQRIEKSPLLAGLTLSNGSLRGNDDQGNTFTLQAPVGKILLADRPVFRWSPLAGATGYVVEVYDNQFNLVLASPPLTSTSWTTSSPLQRDKVYSWQVKASKDGQEFKAPGSNASQATFRILSQAKANELAQARRAYASSPLTLGLVYAQAGLLDEAEAELRVLQKDNPQSPIARQLLTNVRAMRR